MAVAVTLATAFFVGYLGCCLVQPQPAGVPPACFLIACSPLLGQTTVEHSNHRPQVSDYRQMVHVVQNGQFFFGDSTFTNMCSGQPGTPKITPPKKKCAVASQGLHKSPPPSKGTPKITPPQKSVQRPAGDSKNHQNNTARSAEGVRYKLVFFYFRGMFLGLQTCSCTLFIIAISMYIATKKACSSE